MHPPTKLQVFDNFLPKKCYNFLYLLVVSRFISARIFLFPKLKIKLEGLHFGDVAEIQEAVTDELKEASEEEFSSAFQKLFDRAKTCIYIYIYIYIYTHIYIYTYIHGASFE